jgi:AcrR family transcriptional regulator
MNGTGTRAIRRSDALTKARIVAAAIEVLDADKSGDGGALTLRALMTQLTTGSGAIYHHVATMDELRGLAADEVLRSTFDSANEAAPNDALLGAALAIFDSIQAHPWVGGQLTRSAIQPAVVRIWKTIAVQLERLGVHGQAGATAGSTLTSFILGSVANNASDPSRFANAEERMARLESMSEEWAKRESDPLVIDIATQLREHDDRQQFVDGVRIILRGVAASNG